MFMLQQYKDSDLKFQTLSWLKKIYAAVGCTTEVADKRRRQDWQQAILTHQSAQIVKVVVAEIAPSTEQSAECQDLLEQLAHIRYAFEDSGDACINYENGELWLTAKPESDLHVFWEMKLEGGWKSESELVEEILSLAEAQNNQPTQTGGVSCGTAATESLPKTCSTCPRFQPFNDGSGRGLCCGVADSSLVVREHHQQTQDCLHMIEEQQDTTAAVVAETPVVQSGSLIFKKVMSDDPEKTVYEVFRGVDSLGIIVRNETDDCCSSNDPTNNHATPYEAAAALLPNSSTNLTKPTNVADAVMPEIEVDSDIDAEFGTLYRVWYSYYLLGTFYHAADDKWIAQPCDTEDRPRCNSALEAQLIIVAMTGLLIADTSEDAVELLDKPFDQLTYSEWQAIKLAAA